MAYAMAQPTMAVGATCTQFTGLLVTITVPVNGTIVVYGWASTTVTHTTPVRDNVWFKVGATPTDCLDDLWLALVTIDGDLPNDIQWPIVVMNRIESVTAGTYSYYMNGIRQGGAAATLRYGTLVAVFYPA